MEPASAGPPDRSRLSPTTNKVIHVSARIRRVGIHEVAFPHPAQRRSEIGNVEGPVLVRDYLRDAAKLVRDLRDILHGESVGLAAEWHVELAGTVEAHDAIEAGSVQK